MKKIKLIFALLLLVVTSQTAFAQDNKTSKPEDKAAFVKGTRLLEQEPFNKKAKEISRSLLVFLIEAPDVSVTLCSDLLAPIGKNYKYSAETTGQFTFGMGAFIVENPAKVNDEKAVYAGGLESVSKMYEARLKEKPNAKNEFLDGLVEKRTKGELGKLVEDVLSKGGCKSK
jgi:hypothetical protein